jgi:hypothetical protein
MLNSAAVILMSDSTPSFHYRRNRDQQQKQESRWSDRPVSLSLAFTQVSLFKEIRKSDETTVKSGCALMQPNWEEATDYPWLPPAWKLGMRISLYFSGFEVFLHIQKQSTKCTWRIFGWFFLSKVINFAIYENWQKDLIDRKDRNFLTIMYTTFNYAHYPHHSFVTWMVTIILSWRDDESEMTRDFCQLFVNTIITIGECEWNNNIFWDDFVHNVSEKKEEYRTVWNFWMSQVSCFRFEVVSLLAV